LLGLGSVGIETERLDEYSDLDFFVIVEPGSKMRFIDHLDWLSNIKSIAYCFRNTHDGYKLLFDDGIFCEFAVFEPHELNNIPFCPGRIVWQKPYFDKQCTNPRLNKAPPSDNQNWLIGEVMTNLYVGMSRYKRGEKLSGFRFVQQFALDKLMDLVEKTEPAQTSMVDSFVVERRIETRYPRFAQELASFAQGYNASSESALAHVNNLLAELYYFLFHCLVNNME